MTIISRSSRHLLLLAAITSSAVNAEELTPVQQLGKSLFFDEHLSINQNQSCASCHQPEAGWSGPTMQFNRGGAVYEGSIQHRFGKRKPPSAAYAAQSPVLHVDKEGLYIGGNFHDGRATGEKLGNPSADQAQMPFVNPVEQAFSDSACVIFRACNPVTPADYPHTFVEVLGREACAINWPDAVEQLCSTQGVTLALSADDRIRSDDSYDRIALAIAAYEASTEVNPFSSKYDLSLAGKAELSEQEQLGQELYFDKGKCNLCHVADGERALFTDYSYDNLGFPQNPLNPAGVAPDFIDAGLGGFLQDTGHTKEKYQPQWGKHKVPSLRNIDLRPDKNFVKSFGHNGYFKSLEGIVNFYNTRDTKPQCPGLYSEKLALSEGCWPVPEVSANLNREELGNLGLTANEEAAIVAFLRTLSDGYQAPGAQADAPPSASVAAE